MIGSRRKLESIYTRLIQNGTPREQIQRINAPVGIEIGAISPEEIAVSIVAQLVRIRRGAQGPARDKSEIMYSFFHKNDVPS
jgi:xanthine dehydrogenase accessory factor